MVKHTLWTQICVLLLAILPKQDPKVSLYSGLCKEPSVGEELSTIVSKSWWIVEQTLVCIAGRTLIGYFVSVIFGTAELGTSFFLWPTKMFAVIWGWGWYFRDTDCCLATHFHPFVSSGG